jgi:hypothetical protein
MYLQHRLPPILRPSQLRRQSARIENHIIQFPIQLTPRTVGERSQTGVVQHIARPDFDAGIEATCAREDGFAGFLAFGQGADGEHDGFGAQLDELQGGFEADAGVGAGDDYISAGHGWVGCGWRIPFSDGEFEDGGHVFASSCGLKRVAGLDTLCNVEEELGLLTGEETFNACHIR